MQRSAEIESLVRELYESFGAGDPDRLDALISGEDGVVMIGTAPTEWWVGRDMILDRWRNQLQEMAGFALEPGPELQAFEEGDVGWVMDRPSFVAPDGLRVPGRFTVVLHRERGVWKIVQGHASMGVPGEETTGRDRAT